MQDTTISELMMHCAEFTQKGIEQYFEKLSNDPLWFGGLSPLTDSMKYSLLAGGKRIRPFLVMQFAALCGKNVKTALDYSVALEMVHTYSLIHDDLPCMDDDDMRRGRPTNHKVYGDATALLAGDSLLTEAFGVIANAPLTPKQNCAAIAYLSKLAGVLGMAGGQQIDLDSEDKIISPELLTILHSKKTGALIRAACILGCLAAGVFEDDSRFKAACTYAQNIGIAFQIVDDILDVVGSNEKLGKSTGSDERCGKTTYVTLYGIDEARRLAKMYVEKAKNVLNEEFGSVASTHLCELAQFIIERDC